MPALLKISLIASFGSNEYHRQDYGLMKNILSTSQRNQGLKH